MTPRPGPWAAGRVDVQGHRGARGLVVENTLESFTAAYAAGVSGVEVDVRLSADGEVVVWHDAVLMPHKARSDTPGLVGARIADLTLAELRAVDVGSQTLEAFPDQRPSPGAHIATLAEVLALGLDHPTDVWWTVELKVDPTDPREVERRPLLVEKVLACLHDAGLDDRSFVHSFDWSVLELSRDLAPAVARSALVASGVTWVPGSPWTGSVRVGETHIDVCAGAAAVGAHVISPEHVLVDQAFVARARELGLGVLPWTVNDVGTMRALAEAGVDGLVTDYPDLAAVVLADLVGGAPSGVAHRRAEAHRRTRRRATPSGEEGPSRRPGPSPAPPAPLGAEPGRRPWHTRAVDRSPLWAPRPSVERRVGPPAPTRSLERRSSERHHPVDGADVNRSGIRR